LRIDGSLASSVTTAGGRLEGSGTIAGYSGASGGTIAPGTSIGTLNVSGAISFAPGSIFQVEANAAGGADRLTATGAATLTGGTVSVLAANGEYAPRTIYTILTAQGGVGGRFDNATSNLSFLSPVLTYGANAVELTLARNDIGFPSVGETRNQRGAAAGAEALGFGNPIYDAIVRLNEGGARSAFDVLSGESHAGTIGVLLDESRYVREAVLARGSRSAERLSAWAHGYGNWGETGGDGNAAPLDRDARGFLIGIELPLGSGWSMGVAGGYGTSSIDATGRGSAEAHSKHAAAHVGGSWGGFSLTGGGAMAWHRIDSARTVSFPRFNDSLRAEYDARTLQLFGEAAYRASLAGFSLEPFANLAYVRVDTDGFTEAGGAAALTVDNGENKAIFSALGLRAGTKLGAMELSGSLGWRHAFDAEHSQTSLAFGTGGVRFRPVAAPTAVDALLVEAALGADLGPGMRLSIGYNGLIGGDTRDHGARATFSIDF
jgi:outer membrane autotransporter protein